MTLIIFVICLIAGFEVILNASNAVRIFGRMPWAESRFGIGGSITAWKLGGLLLIVVGFVLLRYPNLVGL